MSEVHDFNGFSPDDQKYFGYLDRLWERLPFESYRIEYLKTVIARSKTVAAYVESPGNPYRAMKLWEQNDISYSHFLYYVDALFDVPPERTDRAYYLAEALHTADLSQEQLNKVQIGQLHLYDTIELRTKVEEILLADSDEKAKQDIVEMFEHGIHSAVHRAMGQA